MRDSQSEGVARMLLVSGARACTAISATGLPDVQARKLYKQINNNKGSPPGQTPNSINWYIETTERVFLSALFLRMYALSLKRFGQASLSYAHAYYHFNLLAGQSDPDAINLNFDAERADFLRKAYRDTKDVHGGALSKLLLHACRICGTTYLGLTGDHGKTCPVCQAK